MRSRVWRLPFFALLLCSLMACEQPLPDPEPPVVEPPIGTPVAPVATVPAIPAGLTAVAGNHQVTVSWTTDPAVTYNLYWSTKSGVSKLLGTKVAGAVSPYTLTGLPNATAHYFVVSAVNSVGESALTAPVTGTPWVAMPADRTNYFGMHTMLTANNSGATVDKQLGWVADLTGGGGWVLQTFAGFDKNKVAPSYFEWEFVKKAYDAGLNPIVRLSGTYNGLEYWEKPVTNTGAAAASKADYAELAASMAEFVSLLPKKAGRPLVLEVWNEVNIGDEWGRSVTDPIAYGYFLEAVVDALHGLNDPRLVVLNGALSPGGANPSILKMDYLAYTRAMLTASPSLASKLDGWAAHCYAGGNPPSSNNHDNPNWHSGMSIDSYTEELAVLKEFGRNSIDVYLTETGYSIGNVDQTQQTEYITAAFRDYWSQWPEVKAVCPFVLYYEPTGTHSTEWPAFEWRNADGSAKPMYTAVKALPKLPATAWLQWATLADYRLGSPLQTDNLAAGLVPTVSTSNEADGWAKVSLSDGFTFVLGWCSDGADQSEWVTYDLKTSQTLGRVDLSPRGGDVEKGKFFPVAFKGQVSDDNVTWTDVFSQDFGSVAATWRVNTAQPFAFTPVAGRYFRLLITKKTNHGSGGFHAQLSEIAVYAP